MIELFIASRFIVDFLWEYKILSALQIAIFSFAYHAINLKNTEFRYKILPIDFTIALLYLISFQSFAFQINDDTEVTFTKITLFILIYTAGRIAHVSFKHSKILGISCALVLGVFLVMGALGFGYQAWGRSLTYTGGYFFKTDLALSASLLLIMVFLGVTNKMIISLSWLATMWIVILTNARIFIPIVAIIPIISYIFRSNIESVRMLLKTSWKVTLITTILLFVIVQFLSMAASDQGYLTISLTNFMSPENTQGRTVIWDAIIAGFSESDILTQFFGGGLDSDKILVSSFAAIAGVEDANSHNIFLYTLVSTGIVGVILSLTILYQLALTLKSIKNNSESIIKLKIMVSTLLAILLVAGLTTDAIVRPQLMALTCFFVGLLVQQATKKQMITNSKNLAHLRHENNY